MRVAQLNVCHFSFVGNADGIIFAFLLGVVCVLMGFVWECRLVHEMQVSRYAVPGVSCVSVIHSRCTIDTTRQREAVE